MQTGKGVLTVTFIIRAKARSRATKKESRRIGAN